MRHRVIYSALIACAALILRGATADEVFFREKVEPIFKQHCYTCHSTEAEKIKGGLMLDSKEAVLRGGD
ncbi:MAG: c-type cytochrome domain-containing protein, partial [Limisphaerales bacterium]